MAALPSIAPTGGVERKLGPDQRTRAQANKFGERANELSR